MGATVLGAVGAPTSNPNPSYPNPEDFADLGQQTYAQSQAQQAYQQAPSMDEQKARSFLNNFADWLASGTAERKLQEMEARTGCPRGTFVEGFLGKVLGTIGKVLGIAVQVVGSVLKTILNIIFSLLSGAVNLIINVASALAGMLQAEA